VRLYLNPVAEIDNVHGQRNIGWRIRHASGKALQVFDGPMDLLMVRSDMPSTMYLF